MKYPHYIIVCFLLFLCCRSEAKAGSDSLYIVFHHYAGGQPLRLGSDHYRNSLNQDVVFTRLRYYISNIRFQLAGGGEHSVPGYYLVDEDEAGSKSIAMAPLPSAAYTGITFTLGVDSVHNCSGAQGGALDPVNGMFWTWNTGYIFLKLEGRSPASASPGRIFEFHIGGYRQPFNCIREVQFPFKKAVDLSSVRAIDIKADILSILDTPHQIDLSRTSSVTEPKLSLPVADNYCRMFSLLGIRR